MVVVSGGMARAPAPIGAPEKWWRTLPESPETRQYFRTSAGSGYPCLTRRATHSKAFSSQDEWKPYRLQDGSGGIITRTHHFPDANAAKRALSSLDNSCEPPQVPDIIV